MIDVLPNAALTPKNDATLVVHRASGILPYVLRQLLTDAS